MNFYSFWKRIGLKIRQNTGEIIGFFTKTKKEASAVLCSVVKLLAVNSRSRKKHSTTSRLSFENSAEYRGYYWVLYQNEERSLDYALFCCEALRKRLTQDVGKNTRPRLVFSPTPLSCSTRFPSVLQQNRVQARFLYLLDAFNHNTYDFLNFD